MRSSSVKMHVAVLSIVTSLRYLLIRLGGGMTTSNWPANPLPNQ